MHSCLSSPARWAQTEFALTPLGDRRTARFVTIASLLAARPGGTLPQAFDTWAQLKATYRFFNQPQVGPEPLAHGSKPTPSYKRGL